MDKRLRYLWLSALLLPCCTGAHAQAIPVFTVINGIIKTRKFAQGEYADKTVTTTTYRGMSFPKQRAITDKLSGANKDQILFLEAQLEKCYIHMLTDSLAVVCSANQQASIKAAQAIIKQARPLWGQKYYHEEIAFYLAEDARRQQAATPAVPAK